MSYRDLRNFTEMMRALGYSRLISMENFRSPNFPLVAEILIWLVNRFDPDADIHNEFDTEEDRVLLVRTAAQFLAVKGNIKLNTKKLYQADGYAVKELLKISSVLYEALKTNISGKDNAEDEISMTNALDIASRIQDLKMTRELASQITAKGANLYELLGKEVQLREARSASVNNQLEVSAVEAGLKEAIVTAKESISNTKALIDNISSTEASLDTKIEKKQAELERNQKRLQTLKKVRPPFLEEFERLEIELRQLYQDYITRFRCVAYLEQQVEDLEQAEQERMEQKQAATRRMLEQMRQEEALKFLDDSLDAAPNQDVIENQEDVVPVSVQEKPIVGRIRTAANTRVLTGRGRRRVYGGMTAGDDDTGSLDSDSDLLLDDDDEDDINSQLLGSDDELELLRSAPGGKHTEQVHSDDDDF
ncbi:clusterin associated protein 1 isoform X1 [Lycorma delicatula]|uniref:clusterin associated protein 1 isoform X1 n=2 Tax=Lycorma delicatula TaxID=130591 RepID=UPI003F5185A5